VSVSQTLVLPYAIIYERQITSDIIKVAQMRAVPQRSFICSVQFDENAQSSCPSCCIALIYRNNC